MINIFLISLIKFTIITNSFFLKTENGLFLIHKLDYKEINIVCKKKTKTISNWSKSIENKLVFNAGYFDNNFLPTGYIKIKNQTYNDFGIYKDMVAIKENKIVIKNFKEINPNNFDYIVSSYPLLIKNNKKLFTKETGLKDFRTIIAEKNNNFYIIITLKGTQSLKESTDVLNNFGFKNALNLDGGSSTGFVNKNFTVKSLKIPCIFVLN